MLSDVRTTQFTSDHCHTMVAQARGRAVQTLVPALAFTIDHGSVTAQGIASVISLRSVMPVTPLVIVKSTVAVQRTNIREFTADPSRTWCSSVSARCLNWCGSRSCAVPTLAIGVHGIGNVVLFIDVALLAAKGEFGATLVTASVMMVVAVATPLGLHPTAVPSCGVAAPRC